MKVCNEVIAILRLPIERCDRMAHAREAADQELQQRCDTEKHWRGKSDTAANHRRAPIEQLDTGWHGDEHTGCDKKQIDSTSEPYGKHVVRPHQQTQYNDDHS